MRPSATRDFVAFKLALTHSARSFQQAHDIEPLPLGTPAWMQLDLRFLRPQSHHVADDRSRPLKAKFTDTPYAATKHADFDNCGKTIADALEGIFYQNDHQICYAVVIKHWADSPEEVGATIRINAL